MIEKVTVQLTDAERNDRARNAAALLGRYGELEEQKKETVKELTSQLKTLREEIDMNATAARTGIEDREVECREVPDGERLVVAIVRTDSGETVRCRPMTDDELRRARQGSLSLRVAPPVARLRDPKTPGGKPD